MHDARSSTIFLLNQIQSRFVILVHGEHITMISRNPTGNWPYAFRLRGNVIVKTWIPVLFMTCYTTIVSSVATLTDRDPNISPILISVLGFVVGLSLSFRTTTAYSRWWEARVKLNLGGTRTHLNLARLPGLLSRITVVILHEWSGSMSRTFYRLLTNSPWS